jgi:DNA-3-methyladenine glycosylase
LKLSLAFLESEDVVSIAEQLIGMQISVHSNDGIIQAIITETEAYKAPEDKASHAFGGKRTPRNEVMYAEAGTLYIYLCYGIHHLVNIVTGPKDLPHAVLIRGVLPVKGIDMVQDKLGKPDVKAHQLCNGPGLVGKGLGLFTHQSGRKLNQDRVFLEQGIEVPSASILKGPRIGIHYAEEYIDKPWRFYLKGNGREINTQNR